MTELSMDKLKYWKIFPTEKTWLTCLVFETVEDMREVMVNRGLPGKTLFDYKDCTAGFQVKTSKWNSRKVSKISGTLGNLYFTKNYCSIGTVAHEIQHFLGHWIKGMKWEKGLTKKYNEPIAEMSEDLISQFFNKYYRAFIEGEAGMPKQLHNYILLKE